MSKVASAGWVIVASVAAAGAAVPDFAAGAASDGEALAVAEAAVVATQSLGGSANLTMRFVQEDGPESGHVRVLLTPETRALTMVEARAAAQQAFLEALKEPGLGDNLTRITVVVRLVPQSHPDPNGVETVIVFLHKGGRDWSVLAGE
jgi:hypothetical protein